MEDEQNLGLRCMPSEVLLTVRRNYIKVGTGRK